MSSKSEHKKVLTIANAITCIRIVCAAVLIFCPTFSALFFVFYAVGCASDVLDGIIARALGRTTKFGARLDTIADMALTLTVIVKILRAIYIPLWQIIWIICVAIIKFVNIIIGFILSKRFVAEHTVMNKICGVLLFVMPFCIGLFPPQGFALYLILTCVSATFGAIQEGYMIYKGKEVK